MTTTIDDYTAKRPPRRDRVEAHKARMLAEVRAYRLRELREALGMTQADLAERLNVSQRRISDIERGDLDRSQVDTIRRYVEAVGATLRIEVEIGEDRRQLV